MPTTKTKNFLYRAALPFFAPKPPRNPILSVEGREIHHEKAISGILRRNHITGGAICVQKEQTSSYIFTKAFHTEKEADCDTFFRVASITKMAVALTAAILMDQGRIDPDEPVSRIISGGKDIPELNGVTLRHLLSHTAGLSDPPDLEKLLLTRAPLREALSGRRICDPGVSFRYSNLGYGLIGSVLESITDLSVDRICRDTLFHPLGMKATLDGSVLDEEAIMPVIRILPYQKGSQLTVTPLGRRPLTGPDPEYHYGHTAGSMYTDLPSLLKLTSCVRDGGSPLLSPAYAHFMKQKTSEYGALSPTLSYGCGLIIMQDRRVSDHAVYGHQGFAYGCVDGAFWEESTGNILVSLNGGCSEARSGRIGIANLQMCQWAFRKELPSWK